LLPDAGVEVDYSGEPLRREVFNRSRDLLDSTHAIESKAEGNGAKNEVELGELRRPPPGDLFEGGLTV